MFRKTIAALKVRYRSIHFRRALDLSEKMNFSDINKVKVLSAMPAVQRIWDILRTSVITSCWRHAGLLAIALLLGLEHSSVCSQKRYVNTAPPRSIGAQGYID